MGFEENEERGLVMAWRAVVEGWVLKRKKDKGLVVVWRVVVEWVGSNVETKGG